MMNKKMFSMVVYVMIAIGGCSATAPCANEFGRSGFESLSLGVCLIGMNEAETLYTERVLKLMGGDYDDLTIEFLTSAGVTEQYNTKYSVDISCVAGYITTEQDLYCVPLALPHELAHRDIQERTEGMQVGETHTLASGWRNEDTERIRWLKGATIDSLPRNEGAKCESESAGLTRKK